jgi:hypothetical protein
MEQSVNYAAMKDVQIMSSREVYALSMVQRSNDAAVKDAQVKLGKEECAVSMRQRTNSENYAAVKDAQIEFRREEYAGDTVHTATPTMNLQLLHQPLDQSLRKLLSRILISVIRIPRQAMIAYPRRYSSAV